MLTNSPSPECPPLAREVSSHGLGGSREINSEGFPFLKRTKCIRWGGAGLPARTPAGKRRLRPSEFPRSFDQKLKRPARCCRSCSRVECAFVATLWVQLLGASNASANGAAPRDL